MNIECLTADDVLYGHLKPKADHRRMLSRPEVPDHSRFAAFGKPGIGAALDIDKVREYRDPVLGSVFTVADDWCVRSLLPDLWLPDTWGGSLEEGTDDLATKAKTAFEQNRRTLMDVSVPLPAPTNYRSPHSWSYVGCWSFKTGPLIAISELNREIGDWQMDAASRILLFVSPDQQLLGAARAA